ncbi:MAG TPA: hypothetical protein VHV09_10740 [Trebonia sp.]|nr:hypothetical protein [Trebonia sp.]
MVDCAVDIPERDPGAASRGREVPAEVVFSTEPFPRLGAASVESAS